MNLVAKAFQLVDHSFAIVGEFAFGEPFDVLQHDGRWADFPYEPKRFGEQIPLICGTELTTRYGERWARHPTRQEIDAVELCPVQVADVVLQ